MALHTDGSRERGHYDVAFKAKVVAAYLGTEFTMNEVAAKYRIHQTLVSQWTRKAVAALEDKRAPSQVDQRQLRKTKLGAPAAP